MGGSGRVVSCPTDTFPLEVWDDRREVVSYVRWGDGVIMSRVCNEDLLRFTDFVIRYFSLKQEGFGEVLEGGVRWVLLGLCFGYCFDSICG